MGCVRAVDVSVTGACDDKASEECPVLGDQECDSDIWPKSRVCQKAMAETQASGFNKGTYEQHTILVQRMDVVNSFAAYRACIDQEHCN